MTFESRSSGLRQSTDAALQPVVRRLRNLPLKVHLALFAALLLVPAIILVALLIRDFAAERWTEAETSVVHVADDLAQEIATEIERNLTILRVLSFSSALANEDLAEFHAQAERTTQSHGATILLLDADGRIRVNTIRPWGSPLGQFSEPAALGRVVASGQPYVTDLFRGRTRGTALVNIIMPLSRNGVVTGALAMSVRPERFRRILETQYLGPEWTTAVYDRSDVFVARSRDHDKYIGTKLPATLQRHPHGKPHAAVAVDGVPVVRATAEIAVAGWTIAASVSQAYLASQLDRAMANAAAWSSVLLGLAAVLVTFYARQLSSAFRDMPGTVSGSAPRSLIREANDATTRLLALSTQLRQSEERLRIASEAAGFGVYTVDGATGVSTWSASLYRLLGRIPTSTDVPLRALLASVHPDDRDRVRDQQISAQTNPGPYEFEFRIVRPDGQTRWVVDRGEALGAVDPQSGRVARCAGTLIDITARKEAELAVAESERRLEAAIEASSTGTWEWNIVTNEVRWSPILRRELGIVSGPATSEDFFAIVHPDDVDRVRRAAKAAIDNHGDYVCEFRVIGHDGKVRWLADRGRASYDENGRPQRMVGTAHDITGRKLADERLRLLMNEVNHRSKNMLSLIQAIARHTAADDPTHFVTCFENRLAALAASHELLVTSAWSGVGVADLVRSQLAHLGDLVGSRLHAVGPPIKLSPTAAQTLGMVLHELATNAAKYGALSNDQGRVEISWSLDATTRIFEMSWTEHGGPVVHPPSRRGFGSNVIDRMVRMDLDGDVTLDFAPSGVLWRLSCSADRVMDVGTAKPEQGTGLPRID